MQGLKRKSLVLYKKWIEIGSYCSVLKEDIQITKLGWNQLIEKNKRIGRDIYRRMKLLPLAKEIIESNESTLSYNYKGKSKFVVLEKIYKFNSKRKVRVVLVEDKKGIKTFLSVMDKKI